MAIAPKDEYYNTIQFYGTEYEPASNEFYQSITITLTSQTYTYFIRPEQRQVTVKPTRKQFPVSISKRKITLED